MLGINLLQLINESLSLFGFLKITRIFRIGTMIARSTYSVRQKAILNTLKLVLFLSIFLHLVGCFWYIVVKRNKDSFRTGIGYEDLPGKWYPPLDWINYAGSEMFIYEDTETFDKMTPTKRYFLLLYHAVLIMGSNEMGPVNESEMLYACLILMLSAFLNALLFSDLTVIIDVFSKRTVHIEG